MLKLERQAKKVSLLAVGNRMIENITSRKNAYIAHLRALGSDAAYRREHGEYVCDGRKLLDEAIQNGAAIRSVLWKERAEDVPGLTAARQYTAPEGLFDYASPMKNSPGPLFTVAMPERGAEEKFSRAIALENVQDPGNVGTVIRTAAALGIEAVILIGACADVYSPKTARATMGAIFRARILTADLDGLMALKEKNALPLYGAALTESARDIRQMQLRHAIAAIGSEGRGLSAELLKLCDGQLIIPMTPGSESLNAAVAGAIVMWEMARGE